MRGLWGGPEWDGVEGGEVKWSRFLPNAVGVKWDGWGGEEWVGIHILQGSRAVSIVFPTKQMCTETANRT
jgi:hypothetical protein